MTSDVVSPINSKSVASRGRATRLALLAPMTLIASDHIQEGVMSFTFRPRHPLKFRAGQHGFVLVPGGGIKPFSITSSPAEDTLTIATRVSGSKFKRALTSLKPGDSVRFFGPLLNFTAPQTEAVLVFLAQGIGITPFRSILLDIAERRLGTTTTLIHVGHDHVYRADTEQFATTARYPTTTTEFRTAARAAAEGNPHATFMISGAPAFVKETKAFLKESGLPLHQIKADSMLGY